MIPGGKWATPLFVVGPEAGRARRMTPRQIEQMKLARERMGKALATHDVNVMRQTGEQLKAEFVASLTPEERAAMLADGAEDKQEGDEGDVFGSGSGMGSFHPSIALRLQKLRRMGAGIDPDASERAYREALKSSRRGANKFAYLLIPLIVLLSVIASRIDDCRCRDDDRTQSGVYIGHHADTLRTSATVATEMKTSAEC